MLPLPRALLHAPSGRSPGHLRQRSQKGYELCFAERPHHPGFTRPDEVPAVRDPASHSVGYALVLMFTRMDAVVFRPTSQISSTCHFRSHGKDIVYTLYGATVLGVDFWRMPKDPKKRAQRPGFVRQASSCVTDRPRPLSGEARGVVCRAPQLHREGGAGQNQRQVRVHYETGRRSRRAAGTPFPAHSQAVDTRHVEIG